MHLSCCPNSVVIDIVCVIIWVQAFRKQTSGLPLQMQTLGVGVSGKIALQCLATRHTAVEQLQWQD